MAMAIRNPRDPNTLSNYNNFVTSHTTANFNIDFTKKQLDGSVTLNLISTTDAEAKEILLDTSHLNIKDVKVDGAAPKWKLLSRFEPYGSALSIELDQGVYYGRSVEVHVGLTLKCRVGMWSYRAHTPDVKSTFNFNLRSPLPVLASGLPTGAKDFAPGKDGEPGTLLYTFKQEIPIPSYLFAIASGDIASASIGPRSTVWTGPEEIRASQWELEQGTENFIQAAEKLVYPYAWTTYNVLVLPPSFPYGGMENPIFTFATPTIISGDRENVDVIAHELSHSWSGNLVSNASWEHFWLNEGWTTYLERRIQAAIHGEPHRDFSAIIGWKALQDSMATFGEDHEFTKLVIDLKGKDPDDAFSSIPYEKGFIFLYHLEKLIGKEKWDKFIPHYFKIYARKSLDSYDFKSTLLSFFSSDPHATSSLRTLDWDSWFYGPGFPPKPDFDTSLVDICYGLADKWKTLAPFPSVPASASTETTTATATTSTTMDRNESFKPHSSDIKGWTAKQVVVFLETLQSHPSALPPHAVELMGSTYGFATSTNVEVVSRYLGIGLRARDEGVYGMTAKLLGEVGRMKFVRPLFRKLNDVDRELAVETFEKNKDFYHPICRGLVEKDLFGKK
ncbi:MAG: hypothetical protein M1827_002694 [Pycnora praestabilis]|nr:MAG: hypothetical protein M1827_002694 [Pycnora praestabilis]